MRRLPQLPAHIQRHREVEQQLAEERLRGARDQQLGADLAFEMHVRSDVVVDDLEVDALACRRGCAWCCYGGNVDASAPEAIAIIADLRARLAPAQLEAVLLRIRADAKDTRERDVDARFASKVPCPLLDQTRGECLVYDHRPSTCRGYVSYDAKACERELAVGDGDVPVSPEVKMVHTIGHLTVLAASVRAGLDGRAFPLGTALEVAAGPDAAARWAGGEQLFDAAEVDGKAAAVAASEASKMLRVLGFPELVGVRARPCAG